MKGFLGHWMGKALVATFALALLADFSSRKNNRYHDENFDSWEYGYEAMVPSGLHSGVSWTQITLVFWIVFGVIAVKLEGRQVKRLNSRR